MATLAIQIGVAVGVSVLSSALAPKPKLQPVDRGKLDDIRFTFIEEGGFKPLVYGKRARLGGVIRWGTKTQEHVSSTPGRSGGKGGTPQAPEPPTNNFSYSKSFAIRVTGNQIKAFRNIWENEDIVLSFAGADGPGDYEAEAEGHTLTNAVRVNATQCSGGRAVQLNINTGAVQFNGVEGFGSATEFAFGYVASGTRTCQIWVNGALTRTVTLPGGGLGPSASRVMWYRASDLDIPSGAGNTVRLVNTSSEAGTLLYVDRLYVEAEPQANSEPQATGVVNEDDPFPEDKDYPLPAYNAFLDADGDGFIEGTLSAGGQAQFELYLGTETQLQSPTIVAAEGAANVPAWRGDAYFVARDYLLKNGQLGNFTFEVEPLLQRVDEIMLDLYKQDGRASDAELDFSAMADTFSDGFIIHTRDELGKWIDQLQEWHNFDVVPVDGKIVAVKRGAAPSFTLTEDDLFAHHEGEERPVGAVRQSREDVQDEPATVDVLYLEPSAEKQFHTGAQHAQVQVGDSYDHDTLTFAIVGDPDTAHAVGQRWLDRKALEARPLTFATGPNWRHLTPTDVGDIVLKGVSRRVRLVSSEAELQGLVKFKAIPERASIYTQDGIGQRAVGREAPAVAFPANTLLVVADTLPFRQEDFGKLIVYGAGCPRGVGNFRGYHLNKKDQNGENERIGAGQLAATIGVVETASQSAERFGLEETREIIVKLYHGTLESRTLDEVRGERVNFALYGNGARWEALQFLSVEAQTPTAPFVAQYKVTGILSGLFGTEVWAANHQAGDFFLLFDEAVTSYPMRPADITREQTFFGQSVGQAVADAEVAGSVTFTYQGNSRKPLAIARVERDEATGLAPRNKVGSMLVSAYPRTNAETIGDEYFIEYLSDDGIEVRFSASYREGDALPGMLVRPVGDRFGEYITGAEGNTFEKGASGGIGFDGSLQGSAKALQLVRGPHNFVEATLSAGTAAAFLGVFPVGRGDWLTQPASVLPDKYIVLDALSTPALKVFDGAAEVYSEDASAYAETGVRVGMILTGTALEFRKTLAGPGTPPLASLPLPSFPATLALRIHLGHPVYEFGNLAEVYMTTNPLPTTILTAAQQLRPEVYGAVKKPVRVRIRQHSGDREVGYGLPWEGWI